MAKIGEMDQVAWEEWVSTRPEVIQKLCRQYPPDRLYLMKKSGNRATILAYDGDGTVTVEISHEYNDFLIFERHVFGVDPGDLEECDLPDEDSGAEVALNS